MTEPVTIADVLPLAERVAREVARWSGLDAEDIAGSLGVHVVQRADDYVTLLREGRVSSAEGRLRGEAGKLAAREQVRAQRATGQYYYEPEYVRLFLPFAFDRETWGNGPAPDDAGDRWKTGEAIDTALDISLAWPRLRPWQRTVILARHVDYRPNGGAPDWEGIAVACGYANGRTAEQSYLNATGHLTAEMNARRSARNAEHEGPGSRKAISNAAARAEIGDGGPAYDGGMSWA